MLNYKSIHQLQFAKFLVVGTGVAALNLALLYIFVDIAGLSYLLSCTILFFILNFIGYLLNKIKTFRLESKISRMELTLYYFMMLASLAVNLLLMFFLVEFINLSYLLASLIVTAILAPVNYLLHAFVTFYDSTQQRHRQCAGHAQAANLYDE